MNIQLIDEYFVYIPQLISEEEAVSYADEFIRYDEQFHFPTDDQLMKAMKSSENSAAALYNQIGAVELLCRMTPQISSIVEETVVPSYSFARIYRNNDFLPPHVDRAACEISLTLHIKGDHSWPFEIEKPDGTIQSFELNRGDAVLYLGPIARHSRNTKYQGTEYVQFFLHYVRSRGIYCNAVFDSMTVNNDDETLLKEYYGLR